MAGDLDMYGLMMAGDEPTAQERAQALVAALRGQQAAANNARGMATVWFNGASEAIISGAGVS